MANEVDKSKESASTGISSEARQRAEQQASAAIGKQERYPVHNTNQSPTMPASSPNNAVSKETFSPPQVGVNPHSRTGVTNMGATQTQANRFGMKPPENTSGPTPPEKSRDKDRERD